MQRVVAAALDPLEREMGREVRARHGDGSSAHQPPPVQDEYQVMLL